MLTTAAVLFAVAMGLLVLSGVFKIVNFAPGAFLTLGAYAALATPQLGGAGIFLFGRDVTGQAPDFLVRDGIAYTPQEKAISQDLSARDNLSLATASDCAFREPLPRAFEPFSFFERRLVQKAGTLSGGEPCDC